MYPNVWRDFTLFRQLYHGDRRHVTSCAARPATERRFQFPNRRVAWSVDSIKRDARRKRSTLDRDSAKAKSEIQRIVGSIAKGLITEDEAASLLNAARSEIARLESELATADTRTNVIELHPQAVQRFKENLEALADILVTKDALPDLELVGTFRSLVESVVVAPGKPGKNMRSASGDIWPASWVPKCRLLYRW